MQLGKHIGLFNCLKNAWSDFLPKEIFHFKPSFWYGQFVGFFLYVGTVVQVSNVNHGPSVFAF